MSANSSDSPRPGDAFLPPIVQVETLGRLAVACSNAVFAVHHAAWLIPEWKPLIEVSAQSQSEERRDRLREAVDTLAALCPQLPVYPFNDPFAPGLLVELCGVLATSAHAACFQMVSRCFTLVLLSRLAFDPIPARPSAVLSAGLLATDHSDLLGICQLSATSKEFPSVVWECDKTVERLTHMMRCLFVTNAPAGLAQGESIRAARRLCELTETFLACERLSARKSASTAFDDEATPVEGPLTETQRAILSALDGRALIGKELAKELKCDLSRMQRDHLTPLMEKRRVLNDKAIGGYYRPDAPPS